MNASKILQQLMSQASGSKGSSGGMDVKGVIDGLSRHLGGNSSQGTRQSSGSSGFDMKSLLGGGAMGMLVGSKRGRSMGGKALKYGAIAGVGMLAWKAWQSSQEKKGAATQSSSEGERVEVLSGEYQERRSLELLQAMIMAARADGHIDEQEQALITDQIDALGADQEMHRWVEQQLKAPLDAQALAREADSPQAAREMYLISVAVIDDQNPMERAWLDQLASALNLTPEMAAELEHQAQQAG
ncbi:MULTISPECIES: tellurite resistance TerB family protein [Vreelandella]|uniref:Protein YebE n=1 Tax=Vreelandella lutescens TaxID=1602943 RepID=A0ABQ1P0G6_9GAMM|nr:tellurite resistance TerB family protein [Halomonas lutescens]GGC88595.1 protein YebE [Halomonas lutescens]